MSVESDVRAMLDRHEIHEVLLRYCRGVDRGDAEMLRTVYHEGALDRHGPFRLENANAQFADLTVPRLDALRNVAQHHITNCMIDLRGDVAAVETYFIAYQPTMLEDGSETPSLIGGRYLDRFERRDGRWGIAEREVVVDWSRFALAGEGETWPTSENYSPGGRREADPSHALFATLWDATGSAAAQSSA
jgi:hypothetical protein